MSTRNPRISLVEVDSCPPETSVRFETIRASSHCAGCAFFDAHSLTLLPIPNKMPPITITKIATKKNMKIGGGPKPEPPNWARSAFIAPPLQLVWLGFNAAAARCERCHNIAGFPPHTQLAPYLRSGAAGYSMGCLPSTGARRHADRFTDKAACQVLERETLRQKASRH